MTQQIHGRYSLVSRRYAAKLKAAYGEDGVDCDELSTVALLQARVVEVLELIDRETEKSAERGEKVANAIWGKHLLQLTETLSRAEARVEDRRLRREVAVNARDLAALWARVFSCISDHMGGAENARPLLDRLREEVLCADPAEVIASVRDSKSSGA